KSGSTPIPSSRTATAPCRQLQRSEAIVVISRAVLLVLVLPILVGCDDSRPMKPVSEDINYEAQVPPTASVASSTVSDRDLARVCRAAIAAMMGRDVSTIRATSNASGIIQTEYRRP